MKLNVLEFGISWLYCRDHPVLANSGDITHFNENTADNNSFQIKKNTASQTGDNGTKNVEA